MALPAIKKRKVSSPSGPDGNKTYAQDTARAFFHDPPDGESKYIRGNNPLSTLPAMSEAGGIGTTSWASSTYDLTIFKLKLNELLAKVRPDYQRRMVKVENSLCRLKDIIERIPNREAKPVCIHAFVSSSPKCLTFHQILQAEREQLDSHNVQIPFPQPRPAEDAKYTLAYSRPANINVVGSYARRTAIQLGGRCVIDLAVTMPSVRRLLCPHLPLSASNVYESTFFKQRTI